MSLGDYEDDGDGLRDPDFESEERQALKGLDPGEAEGDPKPLDEVFVRPYRRR